MMTQTFEYPNLVSGEMGATVDYRMRLVLVEGTEPAAWAPAEGETLDGGRGCSHER